eukprot:6193671-Pleurochrysis_carterae.AAC.7
MATYCRRSVALSPLPLSTNTASLCCTPVSCRRHCDTSHFSVVPPPSSLSPPVQPRGCCLARLFAGALLKAQLVELLLFCSLVGSFCSFAHLEALSLFLSSLECLPRIAVAIPASPCGCLCPPLQRFKCRLELLSVCAAHRSGGRYDNASFLVLKCKLLEHGIQQFELRLSLQRAVQLELMARATNMRS